MASLEAKLATAINEVSNLRGALEKEVEERRRDHDAIIRLERDSVTAFNRLDEYKEKIEKIEKEKRDEHHEGHSRAFQLWLAVVTAVIGAIIGALAVKYMP